VMDVRGTQSTNVILNVSPVVDVLCRNCRPPVQS
jgi:hypothetical protein